MILAIDWALDRCRTAVNVSVASCMCSCVHVHARRSQAKPSQHALSASAAVLHAMPGASHLQAAYTPPAAPLGQQILGDAYGCVLVDHLLQRRPRGGGSSSGGGGGGPGSKQIPYVQLELGEAQQELQPQGQR